MNCLFLFLTLASLTVPGQKPPFKYSDSLILVSIDGFRPEYLDRGLTPTLRWLANHGVMADSMLPQFPSLTFPNHYAIATGRLPIHNGIVHNRFFDPLLGKTFNYGDREEAASSYWWLEEPIWNTVQRHNRKSACMFWPGSEAIIGGSSPTYSIRYNAEIPSKNRVDQVIHWMTLPADQRPHFSTLYFSLVDTAGHKYGPDSPEVDEALVQVDRVIAYLIKRLKALKLFNRLNLIVLSDHGMVQTRGEDAPIMLESLLDISQVRWFQPGVVATIIPERMDDILSFYLVLKAKSEEPDSQFEIYLREDLPSELNYTNSLRIPPIVLIAKPGFYFSSQEHIERKGNVILRGQHGYPVTRDNKDIHAIFIAHGPKFPQYTQSFNNRKARLSPFGNLELFELFLYTLGLPRERRDGTGSLVKEISEYV